MWWGKEREKNLGKMGGSEPSDRSAAVLGGRAGDRRRRKVWWGKEREREGRESFSVGGNNGGKK